MTQSLFGDDLPSLDPAQLQAVLSDSAKLAGWEGKLGEMLSAVEHALREQLGEREDVATLARGVVFWLIESMGGGVMYMPKGKVLKHAIRGLAIYHDWRDHGMTPEALARKHRVAVPSVYAILAKQRALHRRREPDLFGFGDSEEKL